MWQVLAMLGDMGRGTMDDSKTWHQYGAPGANVSVALAAEAWRGTVDAVFLFGDLSYAQGCGGRCYSISVLHAWQPTSGPFRLDQNSSGSI
jgi:hypothetical protein